jgi:regulatory protein
MKKAQPITNGIRILGRGAGVVSERWLVSLSLGCSALYDVLPLAVDICLGARTITDREPAVGPKVENSETGPELIERWALHYLGRYASSAENLRRVLTRRVRRRFPEGVPAAAELIDALIARYRESGILNDPAYAAARVQSLHRRGESTRAMRARLAAKGVSAADIADAVSGLRAAAPDLDLTAACAFARRRRLGPFRRAAADRMRELGAFARAGFSRRVAEAVLACADVSAIEALARGERE